MSKDDQQQSKKFKEKLSYSFQIIKKKKRLTLMIQIR